jgi:hypothetical protein
MIGGCWAEMKQLVVGRSKRFLTLEAVWFGTPGTVPVRTDIRFQRAETVLGAPFQSERCP